MLISRVHLPGKIQLLVSPSLALEDVSWSECVKADVDACKLEGIDPQNREDGRSGVSGTSQLQLTLGTGKLSAV